jgi:hypothetical protein
MTADVRALPAPPVDDPVFRAVVAARDPAALRAAILRAWASHGFVPPAGVEAELVQAHYRPRLRARLIVRMEIDRPGRRSLVQYLYLQAYAGAAAAQRRAARAAQTKAPLRCAGPPVFLLPDWGCVAWALPNGPMLRTAKSLLRRRAFQRFLVEAGLLEPGPARGPRPPELIRYVPRHRAVFRSRKPIGASGRRAYIKVYSPGRDEPAAANLVQAARAAAASHGAFEVPSLLAHVRRRRALVMEELPGPRLNEIDPALRPEVYEATGRALAALHASRARASGSWSAEDEMGELRRAMDDVTSALPDLRATLAELVGRLDRERQQLRFPCDAVIHGNMFGDQVLIDGATRVGIVDWDDLREGDPLFDVGRLAANVVFLWETRGSSGAGVSALLRGYERGGGVVDARRLRWHVATALLLRAKISALRPLPESWIADVDRSVRRAAAILAGSSEGMS